MKFPCFKKTMSLFLGVLITLGLCSAATIGASAAKGYEYCVQNGSGTREPWRVEGTLSYRAIVNNSFTAFSFAMPTWNNTESHAVLSMYKWLGNYEKTVAEKPIASKAFTPLTDNGQHWVEFDSQPAGEYLFQISEGSYDVGVWTNLNPKNPKGYLYINGKEQRGDPELRIRLEAATQPPFGVCEPSQDQLIKEELYPQGSGDAIFDVNESLGIHLNVGAPVSGIEAKFGTYHVTDLSMTVSVYAWKGSYADTIATTPLTQAKTILADNQYAAFSFDKVPAGEYLFLFHEMTSAPAAYVYRDVQNTNVSVYADGILSDELRIYPCVRMHFSGTAEKLYLPVSPDTSTPDGKHTAPDEYVIPSDSLIYTHPVQPDTWVFTDGLGRTSLTHAEVGDPKDNKTLAMFYWTWHVSGNSRLEPEKLQELSAQYPDQMQDYNAPIWQQLGYKAFFWNEPVYGFYRGDDAWVQRKQAELLANAGVDVVFTDNTNGTNTWRQSYTSLMNTWSDAMQDGVLTPKVSFMFPFNDQNQTNVQTQLIYQDVFRQNKWQELWFYLDGKPMLMGLADSFNASKSAAEKEISNFFTFRRGEPEYVVPSTKLASWGWLSMYPQAKHSKDRHAQDAGIVEQITVGVAQNHNYALHLLSAMNGNNISGRSYTLAYPDRYEKEGAEASKWGYNFAEQWNYALEVDPAVVFVTGWNEWTASRFENWIQGSDAMVNNAFPDQFNDEYSRDIEPTKGALKDHYYYQLVNFVRQYKGARPIPTPGTKTTIDLSAGQEQWKAVEPYFGAYIGNTEHRDAAGYGTLQYTETSGRNDIIGAQVARDDEFVYFNVECAADITPYTDKLWMTLYLDTDQGNQGWETFEYVINKSAASANTVVLEKFSGNGYDSVKVADCAYTVDGRYMTIKVAKSDLGLSGDDYTINFSWTDNVHDEGDYDKFSGDIMDFYISGDVAPGARFKYSYISTQQNAQGEQTETESVGSSNSTESNIESTAANEQETEPEAKKGCKAFASAGAAIACAAAAAVVLKKKKD